MDRESELALVGRLRAGDPGAFEAVYEAYRARLFSFLVRLSRRRDVAEDLLEETWLRVVTSARRLDPDTRLAPWLFTVARNLYWSYCRSRLLEDELAAGLFDVWPVAPPPSPFEEAAASELERRIEQALATLPARYREVLLLVANDEIGPAEAAAICGIRPEAMRQRLSRARAMLAEALDVPVRRAALALGEVLT